MSFVSVERDKRLKHMRPYVLLLAPCTDRDRVILKVLMPLIAYACPQTPFDRYKVHSEVLLDLYDGLREQLAQ